MREWDCHLTNPSQRQSHSPPANGNQEDYGIPLDILRVSERFPAPSVLSVDLNPTLRKRILELLPLESARLVRLSCSSWATYKTEIVSLTEKLNTGTHTKPTYRHASTDLSTYLPL